MKSSARTEHGTGIEWTHGEGFKGETWNPLTGCTHVSEGCDHCYAAREASGRLSHHPAYAGLAVGGKFTGEIRLLPERLDQPLGWRQPRMVFVNSMSDLFHKDVPDEFIAQVFAVMALTQRHVFQVLTKRPGRMASLLDRDDFSRDVARAAVDMPFEKDAPSDWPLPNVWLGTSVETQKWADVRIPHLLRTPAVVRFLSCEPLLGPVDLSMWVHDDLPEDEDGAPFPGGIDWIIAGGESGPGARPMHPEWARSLRDQAVTAGVPFFFKQWGEWAPCGPFVADRDFHGGGYVRTPGGGHTAVSSFIEAGRYLRVLPGGAYMSRIGKREAGRELDGRTWDEWPAASNRSPMAEGTDVR